LKALTRSVELLASFQRDIGQRMLELDQKWDQRCLKLVDAMTTLVDTVTGHERCIKGLED
jgi:hypothetical protein